MKRRLQEEKERIISLFGLREQEEEMVKVTPLEKFKKIKFYDAKMKPIEFTSDEEEMVITKVGDVMSDGKYGDNAVVRAAVSVKGGKDEPMIKFGSFATDSEIISRDSIFDEDDFMDDGDNIRDYFEIVMTGPDIDDYKVVRVKAKDFEAEDEKEEMEVEKSVEPEQEPVKEEPFEAVMKEKEKRGLHSLLSAGEITNEFTKNQKKVLEKLKGEGYLFKEPESKEGYKRMKVKSGEFNEELTVWKQK